MANGISATGNNTSSIADVRRAALEAKLAKAIRRAQTNYDKVDALQSPPKVKGPGHIGRNVDISI